jgi:WD40 repeat protein
MSLLARAVMSLTNPIPRGTAEASQHVAPPPSRVQSTPTPYEEEVEGIYAPELRQRHIAPGTWLIGIVAGIALAVCLTIIGLHFHKQRLAIATEGETIPEIRCTTVIPEAATSLAFSTDGRRAVSAGNDVLRIWDVEKEKVVKRIQGGGGITCSAFTPDGRHCVAGGAEKIIYLWDVESGEEKGRFEGHTGPVLCLAVSSDGRRLLSGSEDQTIRLWRLEEKAEPVPLKGPTGAVTGIVFAAEGHQALSWSRDHWLRFWDLDEARTLRRRVGDLWEGPGSALSADGRYTVAVDGERVRVANVEGGTAPRTFLIQPGLVTCVTLSADGHRLLAGGEDGTVHIFDVDGGSEICRCLGHKKAVTYAALSPNGRRALTAGADQTTRLWLLP